MPITKTGKKAERAKGNYFKVYHNMMDSQAWLNLDNGARIVYFAIARRTQVNDYRGEYPKDEESAEKWKPEVSLAYREMEAFVNPHQFSRALKLLIENGFITKKQTGGLYRKRNWYYLSEEWKRIKKHNTWHIL